MYNSTDLNGINNTELIIEVGGEDKEKLVNLMYIYTPQYGDNINITKLGKKEKYELNNLPTGKYEFKYTARDSDAQKEEEFLVKNKGSFIDSKMRYSLKSLNSSAISFHKLIYLLFDSISLIQSSVSV